MEQYLAKRGSKLSEKKVRTPLLPSCYYELDVSLELIPDESTYYMSLIEILQWIVELGCIYITGEVSKMSSHACLPRKGHLNKLFYMFS